MVFDQGSGELSELSAVPSKIPSAKPRFAVALDYIYLLNNVDVVRNFGTAKMTEKDYWKRMDLEFYLFNCYLPFKDASGSTRKVNLDITEMSFYFFHDKKFKKVPVACGRSSSDDIVRCRIRFDSIEAAAAFRSYACNNNNRTVFASVKFNKLSGHQFSQYNYNLPYVFEIKIEKRETGSSAGKRINLAVARETDYSEFPDLNWRMTHFKDKYGSSD